MASAKLMIPKRSAPYYVLMLLCKKIEKTLILK